MANTIELKVPDIGGYDDVPVIELLVAVGDTVKKDQGLVTLESDKATMEVPATAAGKIVELKVKVGDKLSEGSVVAILEAEGAAAPAAPATSEAAKPVPPVASEAAKPAAPATSPPRLRKQSSPRRSPPQAPAARRTSNAACWYLAPVLVATPPHSVRPILSRYGAGRTLRLARRRLPQRRLHSVAARCRPCHQHAGICRCAWTPPGWQL